MLTVWIILLPSPPPITPVVVVIIPPLYSHTILLLSIVVRLSSPTFSDRTQHLRSFLVSVTLHEYWTLVDDGTESDGPEDHTGGNCDPSDRTCIAYNDQTEKYKCPNQ